MLFWIWSEFMKDFLGFRKLNHENETEVQISVKKAISKTNANRAQYILIIGIIAEAYLITFNDIPKILEDGWISTNALYYLILHFIMFVASFFGTVRSYKFVKSIPFTFFKKTEIQNLAIFYSFIFLFCVAIVNSLDQSFSDSVTLYIAYMLIVGAVVLIKPPLNIFVYFVSHIAFIVGMLFFQKDSSILYLNLLNGTLIMLCSVVISTVFYKSFYEVTLKSLLVEKVNRKLEILSSTDPLTGLYNRRYFYQQMESVVGDTIFPDNLVCILMDIDAFKRVNDTFGHIVGDQALVSFGTILKSHCQDKDLAVRWGGEEFLLVLFDTSVEAAKYTASLILKELTDSFVPDGDSKYKLTTSAGISIFENFTFKEIDMVISRADVALYHAKNAGKNQICIWHTNLQPEVKK
jgi:diguanylate cyclase (GGDEF)-like protein